MRMWRLSSSRFARRFDGGYGLLHDGRWNRRGQPVTYCATVPSLCVLEKLVHIGDAGMLPDDLMLVEYRVPDDLAVTVYEPGDPLGPAWRTDAAYAKQVGAEWISASAAAVLRVPSVACPSIETADRNFVVNHAHPDAARIEIRAIDAFALDSRLVAF